MPRNNSRDLALFGGSAAIEPALEWGSTWPPVDNETEEKLVALYRSRKWTAFDPVEAEFSAAFAKHHGSKHGIFMVNGTVTLQCALGAYGIGAGDEVIVPSLTWYATAMAAHYLGASPVFVDIDPNTLCIDPTRVRAAITNKTKAIVPVHLYGSMADMDEIMAIAKEHDLRVIEDCAHVHGGVWGGRRAGTIGHVGSFSFQQSKTMAAAEGGICITDDAAIAERIFRMKHIGYGPGQHQGKALDGPPEGLLCYPFRATGFQALILKEQLKGLEDQIDRYESATAYLEGRLKQTTRLRFQHRGRRTDRKSMFGWVILFDDEQYQGIPSTLIRDALAAEGITLYPTWGPVYKFNLFNLDSSRYRIDGGCEVCERTCDRLLWLHHAYLLLDQSCVEKIGDAIEKVFANFSAFKKIAE